jgi:hypothetical protein
VKDAFTALSAVNAPFAASPMLATRLSGHRQRRERAFQDSSPWRLHVKVHQRDAPTGCTNEVHQQGASTVWRHIRPDAAPNR